MKKSEFKKAFLVEWDRDRPVDAAIIAAEAAGVVWDPEEEPFPENLIVDASGDILAPRQGTRALNLTVREKREAARRWNAHARVREKVQGLFPNYARRELLAILDGTEGE